MLFPRSLFACVLTAGLLVWGCSKDSTTGPGDGKEPGPTTGTISGTVIDAKSSAAIAGASVSTQPATSTKATDAQGRYTIADVPPGSYRVTATAAGYRDTSASASVTAGQIATVNLTLQQFDFSGSWTGTWASQVVSAGGQFSASITQSGNSLSGIARLSGSLCSIDFTLSGSVSGNTFQVTLSAGGQNRVTVSGTVSGNSLSGNYSTLNTGTQCDGDRGTIQATITSGSPNLSGTWSGTYSTSLVSPTQVVLTLQQSGQTLTGQVLAANGFTATLQGVVRAFDDIQFTLTNTVPGCPGSFSGQAVLSGNTLTFTFAGQDCLGVHTNGRGTVTRQ